MPRHPPHALTSLAALFAPSPLSPGTSSQTLHLTSNSSRSTWEDGSTTICCPFLFLRLVSCCRFDTSVDHSPTPRGASSQSSEASNHRCNFLHTKLSKITSGSRLEKLPKQPTRPDHPPPHLFRCTPFRGLRFSDSQGSPQLLCRTCFAFPCEENLSGVTLRCQDRERNRD